jgi:hypothetical protein
VAQAPIVQTLELQYPVACAKSPVQLFPQAPQFALSLDTFVSQPSLAVSSLAALQFAQPVLQLLMLHTPAAQARVPLAELQAALHAPQWSALVLTFVSQPPATVQSPYPEVQVPI